jgi:hypothetical protein
MSYTDVMSRVMSLDETPRVTLGIATYNRDTYLGDAISSALMQDYTSL